MVPKIDRDVYINRRKFARKRIPEREREREREQTSRSL
jgi:hypothetical protein